MFAYKLVTLVVLATSALGAPHFSKTESSVAVSTAWPTVSGTDLSSTVSATETSVASEPTTETGLPTGLPTIVPPIIPTGLPLNLTSLEARQQGTVYTGDATYYTPGLGACGETDGPTDFIAAASYILFDSFPGATSNPNNNPICGKSITAHANGNSVTVRITDRCAGCQGEGDLDFSPSAFEQLAPLSVGRIPGMTWSFN